MMIFRYTLLWFILMAVAILNGTLRVYTYGKYMPELRAHQLSTLTGIGLITLAVWVFDRIWPLQSKGQAITVGLIWFGMTLAFEFLFGHYVMGHPWERLFHDYNLLAGRVWVLVLIWTTVVPYVIFRVR